MYTRSYNDEVGEIIIPEHYSGTSFNQGINGERYMNEEAAVGKNPWEEEELHTSQKSESEETVTTSGSALKLPFGKMLSGIFKGESLALQKIGKEELLIIAAAAFLFFTKEGDKECAIMLILLLFLT